MYARSAPAAVDSASIRGRMYAPCRSTSVTTAWMRSCLPAKWYVRTPLLVPARSAIRASDAWT